MIEYGLRYRTEERVFHMRTLHDAVNALKEQDNPDKWEIVERYRSPWKETE